MTRGLLCFLVVVVVAACGNDSRDGFGSDDTTDPPADPDLIEEGRIAFEQTCGRCHGLDGAGLAGKGPQVLNPVSGFARHTVRNGRSAQLGFETGMDAFSEEVVSDNVLDAMIAFLRSAQKPTTGEGLYVRFCGNCHGADALGGRVGEEVDAEKLAEQVREGNQGNQYGSAEYMPSWASPEITDAEVALIQAWVEQNAARGDVDE